MATIELKMPHVLLYIRKADIQDLRAFLGNVEEIVVDPEFGPSPF